jgi:hypothetical protein
MLRAADGPKIAILALLVRLADFGAQLPSVVCLVESSDSMVWDRFAVEVLCCCRVEVFRCLSVLGVGDEEGAGREGAIAERVICV